MKLIGTIALCLLAALQTNRVDAAGMGRVLEFGLLVPESVPYDNKPHEHTRTVVGYPRVALATNQVPAKLGSLFGFHFEINGLPYANGNLLLVTITRVHPTFTLPDGKRSNGGSVVYRLPISRGRADGWATQRLDHNYQLLPGKWHYELKVLGSTLLEQTFDVVAPKR